METQPQQKYFPLQIPSYSRLYRRRGTVSMNLNTGRNSIDALVESNKFDDSSNRATALTKREQEVLGLIAQGLAYKAVAVELGISTATVKKHVTNIYIKLNVCNKIQAIMTFYNSSPVSQEPTFQLGKGRKAA